MVLDFSRRALLAGGVTALGSALAGGTDLATAAPSSAATRWDRSTGTTPISRLGDPVKIASLRPTTSPNVMQAVELTRSGTVFMTQAKTGSAAGRDTTVITRCSGETGAQLDSMTVIDAGHGLGLHVERRLGRDHIWTSLPDGLGQVTTSGGRLARFRYSPGTFTIDAIPGGVWLAPQFTNMYGELQPSVYSFDWARGYAVEWMIDPHTGLQERFTRRRIEDVVSGRDRPVGRVTLACNPPTLQGFTTIDDTFFRWTGAGNGGSGQFVADNPMALDQIDWRTGALIARKTFPTLGQDGSGQWRDGAYEPEGCSVHREADGSATLLLGVTTGVAKDHEWPVYAYPRIGSA